MRPRLSPAPLAPRLQPPARHPSLPRLAVLLPPLLAHALTAEWPLTGTRAEKLRIQKWYTIYKDHITLEDYEIHDGMGLELYYN